LQGLKQDVSVKWTEQQQAAIDRVQRWLRGGTGGVFKLFGYAGTGKTTLLKHLVDQHEGAALPDVDEVRGR
jgi:energy-coupling factor transporter ATP-binding protein EcfA2